MVIITAPKPEGSGNNSGFLQEATGKLTAALQWAKAMASKGFTAVIGRLKSAFEWLKSSLATPMSVATVAAPFVLATKKGYEIAVNVIGAVGGAVSAGIEWVANAADTVVNTVLGWASHIPLVGGFFGASKDVYNDVTSYVRRGWTATKNFGSALLYGARNNPFVSTVTRGVALAVGAGAALLTTGIAVPFIAPFVSGLGGVATIAGAGALASVAGTVELITGAPEQAAPEAQTAPEAQAAPVTETKKAPVADGGLEALNSSMSFINVEPTDLVKDKNGNDAVVVPIQAVADLDALMVSKINEVEAERNALQESVEQAAAMVGGKNLTPNQQGRVDQKRATRVVNGVSYTRGTNADGSLFDETSKQFDARIALLRAASAAPANV